MEGLIEINGDHVGWKMAKTWLSEKEYSAAGHSEAVRRAIREKQIAQRAKTPQTGETPGNKAADLHKIAEDTVKANREERYKKVSEMAREKATAGLFALEGKTFVRGLSQADLDDVTARFIKDGYSVKITPETSDKLATITLNW